MIKTKIFLEFGNTSEITCSHPYWLKEIKTFLCFTFSDKMLNHYSSNEKAIQGLIDYTYLRDNNQ
jgi:hypothetical protein